MQKLNLDKTTKFDLSSWPGFGTELEKEGKKYFAPFTPTSSQVDLFKKAYLLVDFNYKKKETFYIYIESHNNGKQN
jgi:hypothetical protein